MHAQMESEADAPGKVEQADLSIGDRVNVHGLQSEIGQQLNGRYARVIAWGDTDGRCKVQREPRNRGRPPAMEALMVVAMLNCNINRQKVRRQERDVEREKWREKVRERKRERERERDRRTQAHQRVRRAARIEGS